MSTISFRKSLLFRYIAFTVLAAFVCLLPVQPGYAQVAITMPPVGQMIHVTGHFEPPQMVGLKINLKDPFSFGFIMDQGQNPMSDSAKKEEFNKIIKYFLVSLAMPNKDMWVNLSPYESKRIIPEVFGQTEMGRDLLAQDYVLKQFTASLMYPEDGLGKVFWAKVYAQAQARFGTTDINVNTFNKVWIIADHADVYQKGDTAFLVDSHLKVMLDQDFKAIEQNKEQFGDVNAADNDSNDAKTQMASQLVREIIIPAIEKEVNEGQSFAAVRQIYNAEIMATWFKKTLRASLLGQVFADKSKIAGQRVSDPQAKEKIFQQYLLAYKQGVFNFIKQEATPDGQVIPRRYLSGGEILTPESTEKTYNQQSFEGPTTNSSNLVRDLSNLEVDDNTRAQLAALVIAHSIVAPEQRQAAIPALAAEYSNQLAQNGPIAANQWAQGQILQGQSTASIKDLLGDLKNLPVNDDARNRMEVLALAHSSPGATPQIKEAVTDMEQKLVNEPAGRVEIAQVSLEAPTANPQETAQPSAATVQEPLRTAIIPAVTGLEQNLTTYQGPDTNLVQENNSGIEKSLEGLQTEEANLASTIQNTPNAGASTVVPEINSIMPKVEALETDLTELQNKATDKALIATIGKVTDNLENTVAGLEQERSTLLVASQPNTEPVAASAATVQEPLRTAIIPAVTGLEQDLTTYQGPDTNLVQENNSGIEKSLEGLQTEEANLASTIQNTPNAGASTVVPEINSIMPKVEALETDLTELQNKATDKALIATIGKVTDNLENTVAGLEQERSTLLVASQPNTEPVAASAATVQEPLRTAIIPAVTGLEQDLTTYQGPDTNLVQENNSGIEKSLEGLQTEEANLASTIQNTPNAGASTVVPEINSIMPKVEALETDLTELQNKATDKALIATIGKVTDNLENTVAGLEQERSTLLVASQPNNLSSTALGNETPGGINLSNEHLTLNIKVDGAGMPLPPQYQDKALLNLNGLVSIIRSITPITQQNVPALYELTK